MNKKMIQQAQQMQARLKSMQDEIAQTIIDSSAGGGVIKVKILGGNKIESISIDPNVESGGNVIYINPPNVLPTCIVIESIPQIRVIFG